MRMSQSLRRASDAKGQRFAKARGASIGLDRPLLRVSVAAQRLGVTTQTVRNWIRSGALPAHKDQGIWVVDAESVERYAVERPERRGHGASTVGSIEERLTALTTMVTSLVQRETATRELVEALQNERDRFRAEVATAKDAALRVNAAARETYAAVGELLAVLDRQADALAQLLAQASPQDLER
jgi:excisionase family DNA binding protein